MKKLTIQSSLLAALLMTSAAVYAQNIDIRVQNNTGISGIYSMKIGGGLGLNFNLSKEVPDFGFNNYGVVLNKSADDLAQYSFTSNSESYQIRCETTVFKGASSIINKKYTHLDVTILPSVGGITCNIKLKYS